MSETYHIKCKKCGEFNTNRDYCKKCGHLISFNKKLELEAERKIQVEEEKRKLQKPGWVERLKEHPNILCKIIGWFFYSAFLVITSIGAFVAWLLAMIAAG